MSVELMTWVFRSSPYKLGARLVHLALADVANEGYDNQVWMAPDKIAEKANISVGATRRALGQMVADGYLEVVESGGGRGRHTVYRLVLKPAQSERVSDPETRAPDDANARDPDPETRANPAAPFLLTQREPKGNPNALLGFDEFWSVYPARNGRKVGKRVCGTLWAKLSIDDRRAAWRGARHYAAVCNADLTRARDPERFLKHRVWEDWQEPTTIPLNGRRSNGHDRHAGADALALRLAASFNGGQG